jgi:2-pyrone-4,6-dicarboxylate lactonase
MAESLVAEKYADWDRALRPPVPLPPAGSCDCQVHIYGDPARYPRQWQISHELPVGGIEDLKRLHAALGIARAVLVHPGPYETDYRLLIDSLEALADKSRYRGVVVVKDSVPDATLARLSELGVCAARFHVAKRYPAYDRAELLRSIARVREIGWHVRLHMDPADLVEHAEILRDIRDVPIAVDHFGSLDFRDGLDQPAFRFLLERLRHENWWMMVANGNRYSKQQDGWDDAIPFARAYIAAAPDRIIWASDWPHPRWPKGKRMVNDAESLELLYRYVENDAGYLKKILVDNPARLHGFA